MLPSIYSNFLKNNKKFLRKEMSIDDFYNQTNPYETIETGKLMAKAWIKSLDEDIQHDNAQTFVFNIIEAYWKKIHNKTLNVKSLPALSNHITIRKQDKSVSAIANAIGLAAANLDVLESSYLLGNVYTAILSDTIRSGGGVFYTPPALTGRLIKLVESAGIDWGNAKVIDPACGGGAFLAPLCLKITEALKDKSPKEIINHIQTHVFGLEIDFFGGWLTQVFVEVALKDILEQSELKLKSLVRICNSLELADAITHEDKFDLVIGNPPYGKIKLSNNIRSRFKASLYGHPNLYGLFTHLALDLVKPGGIIGFLTPTSFLSGEYFKNLRLLLRKESTLIEIDFISLRKGVFEDVLQETMIALYQKQHKKNVQSVKVNQITTTQNGGLRVIKTGAFRLAKEASFPWILPRTPMQAKSVHAMEKMSFRLKDWGYKISTGPLVWNRHKDQLCKELIAGTFPIIWSESITQDGKFLLKAEKKNHAPYFKFNPDDDWLIIKKPCILLQRTTAKEQNKRLIAAALPEEVLKKYNGVVVENHLNMIIPIVQKPVVPENVLAAFLNSKAVNDAFRTISGSVAVSAYELESLPLPSPDKLATLCKLIKQNKNLDVIESECQEIYNPER